MPCRLLGLFLLVSLFAGAGHAAPLYTLGAPVTPADKSEASLRRVAPATLNPALFSLSTRAKGGQLIFPLFDGEATGVIAHARETAPDDFSVAGELVAGRSGNFTLTVRGGDAALSILDDTGAMIRLTGTPGGYALEEHEADLLPGCGSDQLPQVFRRAGVKARERRLAAEAARAMKGAEPVEIVLLVVYTAASRERAGSAGALEALIQNAVDQGNLAYANSGIALTVTLAHMAEVDYEEDPEMALALAKLTFRNDGVMDEVHTLRNTHEADMVALITSIGDAGGMGWILDALDDTVASQSFSITKYSNLGSLTLPHELGHNMGCDHDQDNITAEGYRLFNYSRGWRFNAQQDGLLYRTIMAYPPGIRTAHFSNPEVLYKGTPTGAALGTVDEANSALTINTSAPVIAQNRPGNEEGEAEPEGGVEYEGFYCEKMGAIYNNTQLRNLLPPFASELFDLLDPPTADLNGGSDAETLTFLGNGMLDCAFELGLLRRVIETPALNLSATGGLTHAQVNAALVANRAQLVKDITALYASLVEGIAPGLLDLVAAYMTVGDDDSVGFVQALLDVINEELFIGTLNVASYTRLPQYLAADGDADGDGASNRTEYDAYASFSADTYVSFALNPTVYPGSPGEGEGGAEGAFEGGVEGIAEGVLEGAVEGSPEGEGVVEGEGEAESSGEGEALVAHTADTDGNLRFSLGELLRVIQFFNAGEFSCAVVKGDREDGYAPGTGPHECAPHDSDYSPQDWAISLSELLRMIQLFNLGGYGVCAESLDGFCAVSR